MKQRIIERRQRTVSLRWRERRTGFDRREDATVEVLRGNPSLLIVVLAVLNVLNILDWRLTVLEMGMGFIEGNPVMAALFGVDSLAAGLFKIALMLTVTLIIWHGRQYRRLLEAAILSTMIYTALITYHLAGLAIFLPGR
jgi:hypothetical protein